MDMGEQGLAVRVTGARRHALGDGVDGHSHDDHDFGHGSGLAAGKGKPRPPTRRGSGCCTSTACCMARLVPLLVLGAALAVVNTVLLEYHLRSQSWQQDEAAGRQRACDRPAAVVAADAPCSSLRPFACCVSAGTSPYSVQAHAHGKQPPRDPRDSWKVLLLTTTTTTAAAAAAAAGAGDAGSGAASPQQQGQGQGQGLTAESAASLRNKQAYADRHGYRLETVNQHINPNRAPHWSVPGMLDWYMDQTPSLDLVVFLNETALFLRQDVPVTHLIHPAFDHVIMGHEGPLSGVLMARNTGTARAFLRSLWSVGPQPPTCDGVHPLKYPYLARWGLLDCSGGGSNGGGDSQQQQQQQPREEHHVKESQCAVRMLPASHSSWDGPAALASAADVFVATAPGGDGALAGSGSDVFGDRLSPRFHTFAEALAAVDARSCSCHPFCDVPPVQMHV